MAVKKTRLLLLGVFFGFLLEIIGAEPGRRDLKGHVPVIVPQLTVKGRVAASSPLSLEISLPIRNEALLNEFLSELYEPGSTNFHRFITPPEFTARFGPTEEDYAAVKNFARTNGLLVTGMSSNRLVLDVTGTASAVENAFQVTLRTYRHPSEARDFFAPDAEPSVGSGIPIYHVSGLNNFLIPRPANLKIQLANQPSAPGVAPASGSGLSGRFLGKDFRAAYAPGVALNGAGQSVALFELDGYFSGDIASYENMAALPGVVLTNILVDGYNGAAGNNNLEVALDIDMAIAMATNLSKVIVYEAQNNGSTVVDVLNRIVSDNLASQISSSWLIGDDPGFDAAYKQMAAQGQTFLQASGDDGAYYSGILQSADDTNITLVGGTTLTMNGSGGTYSSETVWNWYSTAQGTAGSGGGISLNNIPIPSWQTGIDMTTNLGSTTFRNIPDVALTADNILVVADNGTNYSVGGTSAAAPLWAGFMALVNQQAAVLNVPPAGFLNPAVYAIGQGTNYAANFHDITLGNNTNLTVGSKYPASPGYDLCTGWGSPNGQNFINTLVPPDSLLVLPPNGITFSGASGGPFAPGPKTYVLTNSSANPLAWSLVITSAWLNASMTNGTLAAGTATNLTINPGMAAASLGLGAYTASIQFSNSSSHVVQTLPFSLQVLDSLSITPAAGFVFGSISGGPFNSTVQNYSLGNFSGAALNWQAGNTSLWLTVSPPGGALGAGTQTNVAITLNAAASNLVAGVYSTTVFFTNQTSGLVQNRQFTVSIGQSIAQNGGFETGDNTGWPFSGTSADNGVVNSLAVSGMNPHAGSYYWVFGESGTQAFISQTLATAPGQLYLISLWLNSSASPFTGHQTTPNEFSVFWNGTNIFDKVNIGKVGWTNLQFVVNATSINTVLQMGGRDDPYYLGLDDISVVAGNAPSFLVQPTNLTLLAGNSGVFSAAVIGSANLVYQWRRNGTNLVNGVGISGATSNVLSLGNVSINSAANYTLIVTNAYGNTTSSIAALTVVVPPTMTSSSLTNRTLECAGNISYSLAASGTGPVGIQWSLDGSPITGATNASLSLTNVHLPSHTVAVAVTNLCGSLSSNATLTVNDTQAPVISLNGFAVMTNELGSSFVDPGASANDACAGLVPLTTTGVVNTAVVGTNTLVYKSTDGNGNTNTATRTVFVRDTTPPAIVWSFTNVVLATTTNCSLPMLDVTRTNFIIASDLSGALSISQIPTNGFLLPIATNLVVITVKDASGNAAFSTNTIVVFDQTPPMIVTQPQGQTNAAGATVNFNVVASACTSLSYQWLFNNSAMTAQTNPMLALSGINASNAGGYSVIVKSAGGSITSSLAILGILSASSVTLLSSANPDGFKDGLNFTASVTPTNATGSIQFFTNSSLFNLQPLIAGVATSTNLSTLPRGTNLITAIYSGAPSYLPATNSLSQTVTNHPPVVTPVTYPLIAGLPLSIALTNLVTSWNDVDGDTLSIVAINISTNGVIVTNATPSLYYSDRNYVNDQFICTISDGFGGTNFQTISIAIMPQTNATPGIAGVHSQPSGLSLILHGGYGSTYILQSTTNIFSGTWLPIATNTPDVTGVWQFTDTQVTNYPNRFYRLKLGP